MFYFCYMNQLHPLNYQPADRFYQVCYILQDYLLLLKQILLLFQQLCQFHQSDYICLPEKASGFYTAYYFFLFHQNIVLHFLPALYKYNTVHINPKPEDPPAHYLHKDFEHYGEQHHNLLQKEVYIHIV